MTGGKSPAARLESIGSAIQRSPYEPGNYLTRAEQYEILGFPDLAAGDAYKALLLSDEIGDGCGEYHERVVMAVEKATVGIDGFDGHWTKAILSKYGQPANSRNDDIQNGESQDALSKEDGVDTDPRILYVAERVAHGSYQILSQTLLKCGCLKSAHDFVSRGLQAFPGDQGFLEIKKLIFETHRTSQNRPCDESHDQLVTTPTSELPEQGYVRRELYPWNQHEPDRFTKENLAELNIRLKEVAPKCEVRAVTLPVLHATSSRIGGPTIEEVGEQCPRPSRDTTQPTIKQLGLFATEDIAPYETVLHERSILAANNRLYDVLCDACSATLPSTSPNAPPLPSCPDCEDTFFCSTACQSLALTLYHPAVCNKTDFDILAKDPSPEAAASALYLALLGRAFAMSVTQDIHPLDRPETKFLWGDFSPAGSAARTLPFTFHDHILAPLHMLEKMDIDPFANPQLCDTWVINTLYAKFRGTASARFSTDPRRKGPEVCAVHPMWCLANHSCTPNVRWEWGGEIRFWARGGGEVVRWGEGEGDKEGRWEGGIRKGEEVLNHYCDVDLPVQERREWAMGALGGSCMCERCVWEEGIGKEHEEE